MLVPLERHSFNIPHRNGQLNCSLLTLKSLDYVDLRLDSRCHVINKKKMTLFLAALVIGFVAVATAQTPNSNVADVSSFKKLRSWGESSLYEIEASTNYASSPYLIHLIGTKYGQ